MLWLPENVVRDFDQLSSLSCTFQTDEIDCEFINENKHDCVSMAQRSFG
jgi:hypothetical protein